MRAYKKSETMARRFVGDILKENELTRRAVVSMRNGGVPSREIHEFLRGRLSRFQTGVARSTFYLIGKVYAESINKELSELTDQDLAAIERISFVTLAKIDRITTGAEDILYKNRKEAFVTDSGEDMGEEEYYDNLINLFHQHGIFDVIEVKGKRWNLEAYCRMLARTAISRIQNQAIMNNSGTDLFMINKIGDSRVCAICLPHEGKVYSLSGNDSRYPQLPEAMREYGGFHPNCRHYLIPIKDTETKTEVSEEVKEIIREQKAINKHAEELRDMEEVGRLKFAFEQAKKRFSKILPDKFSTFYEHYKRQDSLGVKFKELVSSAVSGVRNLLRKLFT